VNLFPQTRICEEESCARSYKTGGYLQSRELADERTFRITVFTRAYGPLPGFASSLECPSRIFPLISPQFCADKSSRLPQTLLSQLHRAQGGFIPDLLSGMHPFVDSDQRTCLHRAGRLRVIRSDDVDSMVHFLTTFPISAETHSPSRVSATNCARNYTLIAKRAPNLPTDWAHLELDVDDVWNAFFLHTLLNQHEEREQTLVLPQRGYTQRERLLFAIRDENARMVGTGQEHWNHVCDKCCWVYEKEGVQREFSYLRLCVHVSPMSCGFLDELRSVVVDGVTIGHPCCSEHDCPIPLQSSRDHYCPVHTHLSNLCVVISCNEIAEKNFKTCAHPDHRSLETKYDMASKAMFQLRHRLERVSRQTHDSLPTDFTSEGDGSGGGFQGSDVRHDQEVEITADDCNGKSSSGNRTIRARFGRRRTHNDELCVASCGVILGRATFYGSEAPSAVRVCFSQFIVLDLAHSTRTGFPDGLVSNTTITTGCHLVR